MGNNTKLVSILSLLIVFLGIGFLGFGSWEQEAVLLDTSPSPSAEVIPIATQSAVEDKALGIKGERALVVEVVDGDTIKLANGQIVRFIGIDTPETKDPRRPVGCFGKQASNKTKELLTGKEIVLQKDVSDTDKYKRLLRYIYLPLEDGQVLFINDYLVREGYAKVLTYPPDVKFNEQFLEAQIQAREAKKGLWGGC